MTSGDLKALAEIMGEQPVDRMTLANQVLYWYRLHDRLLDLHAEVIKERDTLRRQLQHRPSKRDRSRVAELERELRGKSAALEFAIKRNEVLRREART